MKEETFSAPLNRRELVQKAAGLAGLALLANTGTSRAEPPAEAGAKPGDTMPPMSNMKSMPKHDMSGYGIPSGPPQQIAMLVYPQMTTLDLIGPQQMFAIMGNVQIHLVAQNIDKPIITDSGVPILPTTRFADCPTDLTVLFAPGGSRGVLAVLHDDAALDFMAQRGKTAQWVTSVCTGSLILGAAGLLRGYRATSHWSMRDQILPIFGAIPVKERVVQDRNRMTGAGVTAGMDFALQLAALLRNEKMARAIQLGMEYDPQPPFHAGTLETAGADVRGMMQAAFAPLQVETEAEARSVAAKRLLALKKG